MACAISGPSFGLPRSKPSKRSRMPSMLSTIELQSLKPRQTKRRRRMSRRSNHSKRTLPSRRRRRFTDPHPRRLVEELKIYRLYHAHKWVAGWLPNGQPIYFSCADCRNIKEIAGFIGVAPVFGDIAVLGHPPRLAMFCVECLDHRLHPHPKGCEELTSGRYCRRHAALDREERSRRQRRKR